MTVGTPTVKVTPLKNPKFWGVTIFVLIGLIIGIIRPFTGLVPQGHHMLAIVIIALGLWIFRPGNLPYLAGGTLIIGGGLAFGLPFNVVTAGYFSSAVWVLIPALYFGYALQKTGLGKRVAYFVLKSFEPSYPSLIVSWFIIGVLLSALTPSITVRIAIVMPIALSIIEACKLNARSRGAALISLVAWAMAVLPGTGWLTGSLWGPIMVGFFPAEMKPLATFEAWFQIMALPWLIITVIFVLLVYLILKPKEPLGIQRNTFREQYAALGKISHHELLTAIILFASLIAFTTEKYHHIPTAAVALLGFFFLIIFRIITVPEISSGVNWDVINFFGVTISLSTIFDKAQVASWIGPKLEPSILSLATNPLMFLITLTIVFWLIRFIDVPWGYTTIALTAALLIPLYNQFGLHPVLVSVGLIAAGNCFFLNYQQPFMMVGESILQGKGWDNSHVILAGLAYAVAVIASILISFPYWKMIGVIR